MTKAFKAAKNLTKAVASPTASEQLMVWLEAKPRTYGWGAILAYDRQKANKMLKQEHISRFNSESILLPVTLEVPGGGETKKLYGYEFDAPIMSFENYSDGNVSDEPRCVLRMPIIAGSYMTVAAKGIVTSISVLDPLDGQVLTMTMDLKTGTVNDKKQVMFDIADGTDFSVDVNDNYLDQVDVGKVFKAYFEEEVPDDKKVWALSQIDTSKNEYLKPSVIKLEVRKREGAAEIADGELIVCVGMEGDDAGTSLPDNFEYLTASNSATLLLGQKTLLEKVIQHQFLSAYGPFNPVLVMTENGWAMDYTGGSTRANEVKYVDYPVDFDGTSYPCMLEIESLKLEFSTHGIQRVVAGGEEVRMLFSGESSVTAYVTVPNNPRFTGVITPRWNLEHTVAYQVDKSGGGVSPTVGETTVFEVFFDLVGDAKFKTVVRSIFSQNSSFVSEVEKILQSHVRQISQAVPDLNTFVLESILFKNEDTVTLSSCALPNDLVMFGDVGPTATAFEITPMEAIILHGKTQQFSLVPQGASSVTWSVESASDDPEFVGSIDPSAGVYTAPDLSGYQGNQTRVRVIATYGNYKTYALVSVLKKTITVNPLVSVKVLGEVPSDKDKVTLTANSADGKAPSWKLKKTGLEGTLESTTGFSNVYTPRPYDQVDFAYVVDEIIVTDSAGIEHTAVIVVDHGTSVNSGMTEGSSTATTVQLQCKMGKDDVTASTAFNVLLGGSGTINETGLYTQAQDVVSPFALVSCVTSDFGREVISYILIPLPLSVSGQV